MIIVVVKFQESITIVQNNATIWFVSIIGMLL